MKTFKLGLTAAAALALCTSVAQASPVVTSWSVINTATFVNPILPAGNTFPDPVLSSGNTVLSWGDTVNQSSLVITNSGAPVVVPDATLTSTVQVTHNNFPIPAGNSLTQADILASLSLTSATPSVGAPLASGLTFTIRFIETPNGGTAGICANGGLPGFGINSAGCADIFVLSQNSLNFPFSMIPMGPSMVLTHSRTSPASLRLASVRCRMRLVQPLAQPLAAGVSKPQRMQARQPISRS